MLQRFSCIFFLFKPLWSLIIKFLSSLLVFRKSAQYADMLIKKKHNFKHVVSGYEDKDLVKLGNGEFVVPVEERTRVYKNLIIKFCR